MSPEIINMEGQVGIGYRTRALEDIDGIGVHYTVTVTPPGASLFVEDQHIRAIDTYHSTSPRDWGGIGYHYVLFDSGRIYGMGSLRCQRAGVANHNRHLVHMAFVTKGIPSAAAIESGRWLIGQIEEKVNNVLVIAGHRQWADASHPTDCPGPDWQSWLPAMIAEEGDMATEWERYTEGLVKEKLFFGAVEMALAPIWGKEELLPLVWRRSDADPPLDHEHVFRGLSEACDDAIAALEALKKRATDRGF